MKRFAIASILCGLVLTVAACGLTDTSGEMVEVQIVVLDEFADMWATVELNSVVVFADTLRGSVAHSIPPLLIHESVRRGEYHVLISVREGDAHVLTLNTKKHRSVWFDIEPETGRITYQTYREVLVVEG
jgi:hypothetical protein